ncbi:MAG TPA: DoxX family protein [Rhizomicrobium sp.]|jgi:putative oxidoreductase
MMFLSRFAPQCLALLRVISGLLFLEHGTMKLFQFPAAMPPTPANFAGVILAAGIIEFVTGALITVGLFTRLAAFIAAGEMAVAYWMVHFAKGGFWPVVNGGGEAILFCSCSSIWPRRARARGAPMAR